MFKDTLAAEQWGVLAGSWAQAPSNRFVWAGQWSTELSMGNTTTTPPPDPEELLARMYRGEEHAFTLFMALNVPAFHGYLLSRFKDVCGAKQTRLEYIQLVSKALWERIQQGREWDDADHCRKWFCACLRNRVLKTIDSAEFKARRVGENGNVEVFAQELATECIRIDNGHICEFFLERVQHLLTPGQRSVLKLFLFGQGDLTDAEIMKLTGSASEGAVSSLRSKATKVFVREFKKHGPLDREDAVGELYE